MELKTVSNGNEYWWDAFGQDGFLSCDKQQEWITQVFIAHRRDASILHVALEGCRVQQQLS